MPWKETVNDLAQEAILLDPGNLKGCGKILKLLETLDQPEISTYKECLKEKIESIIMKDLGEEPPTMESITELVEIIQKTLNNTCSEEEEIELSSEDTPEKNVNQESSESSVSGKRPQVEIPMEDDSIAQTPPPSGQNVKQESVSNSNKDLQKEKKNEPEEFVIEDAGLLRDFINEANEHLDTIEVNLVEWEKSPGNKEIINSIFRPFHTIKGVAGFLNLREINKTSHQLENLLDEAREGRLKLCPELSDLIFDGVDVLKSMVAVTEKALDTGVNEGYGHIDIDSLYKKISMFLESVQKVSGNDDIYPEQKAPLGEILVRDGKVSQKDIELVLEKQSSLDSPKPIGELLVEENVITRRDVRDIRS